MRIIIDYFIISFHQSSSSNVSNSSSSSKSSASNKFSSIGTSAASTSPSMAAEAAAFWEESGAGNAAASSSFEASSGKTRTEIALSNVRKEGMGIYTAFDSQGHIATRTWNIFPFPAFSRKKTKNRPTRHI